MDRVYRRSLIEEMWNLSCRFLIERGEETGEQLEQIETEICESGLALWYDIEIWEAEIYSLLDMIDRHGTHIDPLRVAKTWVASHV